MAQSSADTRQQQYWDQSARRYDSSMRLFERFLMRDTRSWICGRATGRTLEVAVGTGLNLAHYPTDVSLVALELSPEMLAVARGRAAELGRPVEFHQGTATQLPLPDNDVDTVVCTLALCTIPDPAAAIAEMVRVVKPGGRVLLADHVVSTWPPVRGLQRLIELRSVPHAGEHFTRRPLPLVEAAGLAIIEQQRFLAGAIERLVAVKPDPSATPPSATTATT